MSDVDAHPAPSETLGGNAQALIEAVRAAGLHLSAELFERAYWGYVRVAEAYRYALPYVDDRSECPSAAGALNVVTYAFNNWTPLIPGAAAIDNTAVRREAAADEAWHREEDRRMRRDAGEEFV